jgi:putative tricarboxylic transport membrane protein
MSTHEEANAPGQYTASYRSVDAAVAVAFMVISLVVMWDSWSIGSGWVSDGPQAGYFPFYIGLIMFIASLGTLVQAIITKTPNLETFVGRTQLWSVLRVLIPTAVFVALIPWLGLYVAGGLYIGFFMMWIGKYGLPLAVAVGVAIPLFLFTMFDIWFMIPLPKGPVENFFGF